ncbi:MAG: GNAT family N-acetyltransferase [Gammaproteobacteria bacterium]|nr:GNAT family N-acetyltransferase [Gammaproteobacteria bacterium]
MNTNHPLHPRDYPVFRPHWDERPEELLGQIFQSEEELDWVRIAKHEKKVVAAYQIARIDQFSFSISSLAVNEHYSGEGIGHWMLLHALGLIESKGGRIVRAKWGCNPPLLERVGFRCDQENSHWLHLDRE